MIFKPNMEKDYKYGEKQEKKIYPILKEYFNCNLKPKSRYSRNDFEDLSLNLFLELKSRKLNHNSYDKTIFDYPKFKYLYEKYNKHGGKNNCELYLIFNYLDGLYYLDFDILDNEKYKIIMNTRNKTFFRKDGEKKDNINIPIKYLTELKEGYFIDRN